MEDLTGQRFGKLTVKSFARYNSKKQQIWLCECDCGNQKEALAWALKKGDVKSCGCLRHRKSPNALDLTGQRFGRLTAIEIKGKKRGKNLWFCKCDCGNTTLCTTDKLTCGTVKSCGCAITEAVYEKMRPAMGIVDDTIIVRAKSRKPTRCSTTGERCVFKSKGGYDVVIVFRKQRYARYGFKDIESAKKWRDRVYEETIDPYIKELEEATQ